jgi:hypothetical protein
LRRPTQVSGIERLFSSQDQQVAAQVTIPTPLDLLRIASPLLSPSMATYGLWQQAPYTDPLENRTSLENCPLQNGAPMQKMIFDAGLAKKERYFR